MFSYCLNKPVNRRDTSGNVSEEEVDAKIEENLETILGAAEEFDVEPVAIVACIFIEQTYNVNWADWFDSGLWFLDTSIGLGQVKVSTAQMLEDQGYIEKTNAIVLRYPLSSRAPGITLRTRKEGIARKLEDPSYNIRCVAAYLRYHIDAWESYADISNNIPVLATLYNVGYKKPHKNPQAGLFGKYYEKHKEKILSYINR